MLQPAVAPAEWAVEKTYSTATVEPVEPDESCVIKVYPLADKAESAWSVLMRAKDLSVAPNHLLVQQLVYADSVSARQDFPRIVEDAREILETMLNVDGDAVVAEQSTNGGSARYHYVAANGRSFALHVERRGAVIAVIRAQESLEMPWQITDSILDQVFAGIVAETAFRLTSHDGRTWRPSYGPIDFHPSAYEAPVCA